MKVICDTGDTKSKNEVGQDSQTFFCSFVQQDYGSTFNIRTKNEGIYDCKQQL